MSKMRMPEMSIVRFTESDQIVASNGFFTVHNTGDTTGYNLYITNPDNVTIYKNSNTGPSVNQMSDYGGDQSSFRYSSTDNPYSLFSLTENDSHVNPTPVSGVDGNYLWFSEERIFKKQ